MIKIAQQKGMEEEVDRIQANTEGILEYAGLSRSEEAKELGRQALKGEISNEDAIEKLIKIYS
ncbi:MAG: hypothetical protein ABGY95_09525 [Rubritalea sp.]|uniref:hypothetical protein n=1 Tax=Rubritalea sp. TaxID=2109375 RepID=UPI003241C136